MFQPSRGNLMLTVRIVCIVVLLSACTAVRAEPVRIVVLGDSITRGVRPGVKAEETFASLLDQELRKRKLEAVVINSGVGSERTDLALKRLGKMIADHQPH